MNLLQSREHRNVLEKVTVWISHRAPRNGEEQKQTLQAKSHKQQPGKQIKMFSLQSIYVYFQRCQRGGDGLCDVGAKDFLVLKCHAVPSRRNAPGGSKNLDHSKITENSLISKSCMGVKRVCTSVWMRMIARGI